MAKSRNCVNCGAPIENDTVKCPYCGTSYFDFTDINISSPVVLRIRRDNNVLLLKAMCMELNITHEPECTLYDTFRRSPLSVVRNINTTVDMSFTVVN